jgi:hypothetical protein
MKENYKLPDEIAALVFNTGRLQALFSSQSPLEKRNAALKQAKHSG